MLRFVRLVMTIFLTFVLAVLFAELERRRTNASGSAPRPEDSFRRRRAVLLSIVPGIVGLGLVVAHRAFMLTQTWAPLAGGVLWSAVAVVLSCSDPRVRQMCRPVVLTGETTPDVATAYAVALGLVGWTSARGLLLNVSPVRASSVLLIVLVSFSVSVGEETFYRGWLLVHWNASTTKFLAGAASLLLFVIAHFGGDWFVIVRALILGAVMTWVTQEKNNLLPAVLLHTVANVGFVSHDLAASGALMPLSLGR